MATMLIQLTRLLAVALLVSYLTNVGPRSELDQRNITKSITIPAPGAQDDIARIEGPTAELPLALGTV